VEGMTLLQTDELPHHDYMSERLAVAATLETYYKFGSGTEHNVAATADKLESRILEHHSLKQHSALSRRDFSCFDPIAVPSDSVLSAPFGLVISSFDGPLEPIVIDIGPYVRSIVQYDLALEEQRGRLDKLIGEGEGKKAKRTRTTRAARSALEGSQRATTRRERWFTKGLDLQAVLATGGDGWPKAMLSMPEDASSSPDGG